MPNSHIPQFIVDAVYYAWKFVGGAFGREVKRPWRSTICGPFWVSLLMLTVGLPLTLLGWLIRIVFGSGKAEKYSNFVHDHSTYFWGAAVLGFVALLACSLVFWIAPLIEFFIVIGILVVIVVLVLVLLGIVGLFCENRSFKAKQQPVKQKAVKTNTVLKAPKTKYGFIGVLNQTVFVIGKILLTLVAIPFTLVIVPVFMVLRFVALMIHAAYKRYCPLVVKE